MAAASLKLVCLLVVCMVVAAPAAEAAISCGTVASSVASCMDFLKGPGTGPVPAGCCNGIKSLNAAATTTPDRQAVCKCLKQAAGTVSGIDLKLAENLPGLCQVSVPYKISPSTNCDNVK